jgi:hypothetical protein
MFVMLFKKFIKHWKSIYKTYFRSFISFKMENKNIHI